MMSVVLWKHAQYNHWDRTSERDLIIIIIIIIITEEEEEEEEEEDQFAMCVMCVMCVTWSVHYLRFCIEWITFGHDIESGRSSSWPVRDIIVGLMITMIPGFRSRSSHFRWWLRLSSSFWMSDIYCLIRKSVTTTIFWWKATKRKSILNNETIRKFTVRFVSSRLHGLSLSLFSLPFSVLRSRGIYLALARERDWESQT